MDSNFRGLHWCWGLYPSNDRSSLVIQSGWVSCFPLVSIWCVLQVLKPGFLISMWPWALAVLIYFGKVTLLGISKQPGWQCWTYDGVNMFTKGQNHPTSTFKLRVESRGLGDGLVDKVFTLPAWRPKFEPQHPFEKQSMLVYSHIPVLGSGNRIICGIAGYPVRQAVVGWACLEKDLTSKSKQSNWGRYPVPTSGLYTYVQEHMYKHIQHTQSSF